MSTTTSSSAQSTLGEVTITKPSHRSAIIVPRDQYESIPKLSDIKPESTRVTIEEILNRELIITEAKFMQYSNYGSGPYVVVEANRITATGKILLSFTTSCRTIMDQLDKLKDKMPFRATVKKIHGYYKLY